MVIFVIGRLVTPDILNLLDGEISHLKYTDTDSSKIVIVKVYDQIYLK